MCYYLSNFRIDSYKVPDIPVINDKAEFVE